MIPATSLDTKNVDAIPLLETAQKRKILAEFQNIANILKSNLHDEMTEALRVEYTRFKTILDKTRSDDAVLYCFDAFTTILQNMLRDPIFRKQLDSESLLGSDGRTYGKKSLSIYLASIDETARHRSPLNPYSNASCYYVSHPVVQHMVQFLDNHNKLQPSVDVEKAYEKLKNDNELPEIPTEDSEDIRLFLAQQAEREKKKNARMQESKSSIQAQMNAKIQDEFAKLRIQKEKDKQDLAKRMEELEKRKQIMKNITEEARKLRADIEALAKKIPELEEVVQKLHDGIDAAKKEKIQLEIAYHQAMKALKEREEGYLKSILEAGCWIVAAYVANQILPGSFVLMA